MASTCLCSTSFLTSLRVGVSNQHKLLDLIHPSIAPNQKKCGIRTMAYSSVPTTVKTCHYEVLGVHPSTTCKQVIKKAYRRLALQYHPDVCQGDFCERKFMQITDAYQNLMEEASKFLAAENLSDAIIEGFMGVGDDSWEAWEEWMGWDGAGTRDYTSHINNF